MVKNSRGGRRAGSGAKTFFKGKSGKAVDPLHGETPPPQQLLMSWQGFKAMERNCKRLTKELRQYPQANGVTRISRNVFFEALSRIYGDRLTLRQIIREDEK
jgi:hypothetical protein